MQDTNYNPIIATPQGLKLLGKSLTTHKAELPLLLNIAQGQPVAPRTIHYVRRASELMAEISHEDWENRTPHRSNDVPILAKANMLLALSGFYIEDPKMAKLRLRKAERAIKRKIEPYNYLRKFNLLPVALADAIKYSPDQPRVPAGNPDGGQWTSEDSNSTPPPHHPASWYERNKNWIKPLAIGAAAIGGIGAAIATGGAAIPEEVEGAALLSEEAGAEGAADAAAEGTETNINLIGQNYGKLGTVADAPNVTITNLTDYAAERATTRNVSLETIMNTVNNPNIVFQQSSGRYLFLSDKAGVVINPETGEVITTYPSSMFDDKITAILNLIKQL